MRGDQTNPASLGNIIGIQKPALQNQQIANLLEPFGHAHQIHVALNRSDIHSGRIAARSRHGHHSRDPRFRGVHVLDRQFVLQHDRPVRVDIQPRVDQVGSDAFDLLNDVAPPAERHRHDQNDARAADDHAQRGQKRADFVRPKSVQRDHPGLVA